MGLYDRYLAFRLGRSDASLPETIALIITERDLLETGGYDTLESFVRLAFRFDADRLVIYVSVLDSDTAHRFRKELAELDVPYDVVIRGPEDDRRADARVQVSIGLGGKHEFATAVKGLAEEVEAGSLDPADIDESDVDRRLIFPFVPDLVVKTGGERLSDFMIWQSVYAELYFTDLNWQRFRKREYLRALRDFQERQRRFGR